MALAIFGGVFLFCRSFESILHIYVAAYNFKNIALVAAVYSSSEFSSVMLYYKHYYYCYCHYYYSITYCMVLNIVCLVLCGSLSRVVQ